jgi:3-oxoacyl-[acyl-carrier protein] reductase
MKTHVHRTEHGRPPDEESSMTRSDRPLVGKAALVTGGGRGLGRGFAVRLAALGANVAVSDINLAGDAEFELDRTSGAGRSVTEELEQHGIEAFAVEHDAADFTAQAGLVAEIRRRWGRLHIVVCNAGGSVGLPGVEMGPSMFASRLDPQELDLVLRRNLVSAVATCVAVADVMKEQRSGAIVTIGSVNGIEALRSGASAHYGAAKAAVIMYTRYLAQELGPFNVRVNCLAPAMTRTGRMLALMGDQASAQFGKEATQLEERNALGRVAEIDDCVDAMEFLCTDASRFYTGHVLPVDGGELRSQL